MKPTLVWCVWSKGFATGRNWALYGSSLTNRGAKAVVRQAKEWIHDLKFKITRHEVEGPR